MSMESKIEGN